MRDTAQTLNSRASQSLIWNFELPDASPASQDNQFLSLELGRINLLILKHFLTVSANMVQSPNLKGLALGQNEVLDFLMSKDLGEKAPQLEDAAFEDLRLQYEAYQDALDKVLETGIKPRLLYMAEFFHLSLFEYHAFLVCLAQAYDPRYRQVFGFLNNDVTQAFPTSHLLLSILLEPGEDPNLFKPSLSAMGTLRSEGLLLRVSNSEASSEMQTGFIVAPEIAAYLSGNYQPPQLAASAIHINFKPAYQPVLIFDPPNKYPVEKLLACKPLVCLYGPDTSISLNNARAIAVNMKKAVYEVDLAELKNASGLNPSLLKRVLRDAALLDAAPIIKAGGMLGESEAGEMRTVLDSLLGFDGVAFLCVRDPLQSLESYGIDRKPILGWEIPAPGASWRKDIWQHALAGLGEFGSLELGYLAEQFELTSSQIQEAAARARDLGLQQMRSLTIEDLYEAARQCSSKHLDQLALKIEPRYGWADIVLPEEEMDILHEIVSMVRERTLVLEDWGLGSKLVSSKGIASLFAGEPGTGKTLAAQVIAKELGMDLYKIDLSTVVSKYIGETEKNLEMIFTQARNSNAILFFDEADSIFGKRSEVKDAHDRYANIEVGYLLQRMETYDGIVILATNLHANMDDAFTRRLQFIVDFPFPDADQREAIWNVLFPSNAPRTKNLNFKNYARRFPLAGGNIRNVIVHAAFAAASAKEPISHQHLIQGIKRELKKMGRLIDDREIEELQKGIQDA
jgi:hypothetical protein